MSMKVPATRSRRATVGMGRPAVIRRGGTVKVGVDYPDGTPVSGTDLAIRRYGRWGKSLHRLGSARPARGKAVVKLTIPRNERGREISIRVLASARDFIPVHAPWHNVRVR
jgi:hypothetical protein